MTWTVDGTPLSALARNVTAQGTAISSPGVRGENVEVPARHGALYTPSKPYGAGELTLRMWVSAPDAGEFKRRYDALLMLFVRRHGLVEVTYTPPGGTARACLAECTAPITYKSKVAKAAPLAVQLTVPGAFWRDITPVTWTSPLGLVDGDQLSMPDFAGATAPMDDLVTVLTGPADRPRVTVLRTGAYVAYGGSLAEGEDWRVDAAAWTSVVGSGIGFDAPGTSVIGQTTHAGSARLFELPPPGSPSVAVVGINVDNPGAGTQIRVRGKRAYLLA